MSIELQDDFSRRKARNLARLCSYTFFLVFLASVITTLLPPRFGDPQRLLGVIAEVLERSTLPAVALLFLFFGFSGDALPALWEFWLARWLRLLLRAAALFYLLSAMAVVGVGQQLSSSTLNSLDAQLRTTQDTLSEFRQQLEAETSVERLRQVVASQPQILQALQQEGTPLEQNSTLPELRQQVERLLTRAEANLLSQAQLARSNSFGQLARQMVRLSLTALFYALYYLGASFIWPRSLQATVERVLETRRLRQALEDDEQAEETSAEESVTDLGEEPA
ncbi:HpsJ family protein [Synechococcus sp. CS-603]|uniref:HpsJ family protein n=1 Tax=Synechococcus sp. CS-603 TaxID=2847981 RepID=UPI00223AAAB3|nr:HpsJ family protein [Synechococcus sp. CS-603]MCT0202164.1 HpsJ family protein [Synechococcus sp. CS-603]